MNELSFEIELRNTFISETQEMLEETESIFMQLELHPEDLSKMAKLLRIIHTIKGSGAVVGYNDLTNFIHKFETILVAARDKIIDLSSELLDLFLQINDILKKVITTLQDNQNASLSFLNDIEKKLEEVLKDKLNLVVKEHKSKELNEDVNKNNEKQAEQKKIQKSSKAKIKAPSKGKILLCDDEKDILESLQQILEMDNYTVLITERASKALEILKSEEIDIIVTDLAMPEMDGLTLSKEIRQINQFIPIVFVSGHIAREHAKKFMELGVTDFVDKPFTIDTLLLAIDRALQSKSLWKEILKISRACFKTFVYIQKMESLLLNTELEAEILKERTLLKECLNEIQKSTMRLLEIEKDNKEIQSKVNIEDGNS
ncbi:response regulator [Silvanigrella aquatica]|uniref:Response regulatory domain-containing protein n=1 Tax=Silvanigrella aquatica TaxID=1915309 RepID=A0A1L4CYV9_9BACT|nr:response regulator [Silvanigrella aquatica]APJ03136.1 hypothetical protein AXG55_04135 [Silvanigrella aquatica]